MRNYRNAESAQSVSLRYAANHGSGEEAGVGAGRRGSSSKVAEVVMDRKANGWSPEEIDFQHLHLSMAQIHAALAYYYEHQVEIDRWIQMDVTEADRLALQLSDPEIRRRLIEAKLLR